MEAKASQLFPGTEPPPNPNKHAPTFTILTNIRCSNLLGKDGPIITFYTTFNNFLAHRTKHGLLWSRKQSIILSIIVNSKLIKNYLVFHLKLEYKRPQ